MAADPHDEAPLAAVAAELDAVEAALGRLEDGTFDRCRTCGAPLGRDRLVRDPLLTRCDAHAGAPPSEGPVAVLAGDQPLPLGGEEPEGGAHGTA